MKAKERIGAVLDRVGSVSLPLGIGAVAGFYAADHGVRWLPDMIGAILVLCLFALLSMVAAHWLQGTTKKEKAGVLKLRKRIILCLVLAGLALTGRLVVLWMEQASPLTDRSESSFNEAFEVDKGQYRDLIRSMDGMIRTLEKQAVLTVETDRVLSDPEECMLIGAWKSIFDHAMALDQIRVFYEDWYRFDPSRAQRSFHVRSFLLTYAAELALYRYSVAVSGIFLANKNVEKFLDAPHPDQGLNAGSLSWFRQQFQGSRDLARVVAGRQTLTWFEEGLGVRGELGGWGATRLWEEVADHLAVIETIGSMDQASLGVKADTQVLERGIRRAWYSIQSGVAEWMGDTRVRRPGWYLITPEQLQEMEGHLRPGDILLSRKNWYLSNIGLPGFWPHAILYIGGPDRLRSEFNGDATVLAYLAEQTGENLNFEQYLSRRHPGAWARYLSGAHGKEYVVIEAISEGVVFNTIEHAAGDYLAAMRPRRIGALARAQAIIKAFDLLGRPYDFDFDFSTDHALVCTELVWRSYRPSAGKKGLNFPLVEVVGRQTLPANEMAKVYANERGLETAQLEFVYFLDAREKEKKAVVSTEEIFAQTHARVKWDISQE